MLEMFVTVLKDVVQKNLLLGSPRTQIGIITYDSSIHFYNLSPKLKQPQMIVISDLDNLFLPIPDDILVNVHESKEQLLSLLDSLPNFFVNTTDKGCCLMKAINAAVTVFKHLGGKMVILQANDKAIFDEVKIRFLILEPQFSEYLKRSLLIEYDLTSFFLIRQI